MTVVLKTEAELRTMREAGQIVGQTLDKIRAMVRPGLNLLEVERLVHDEFKRRGAKETFRNYTPHERYRPFPSNVCISVNNQLVHGIPKARQLQEGDIVTFDLGATYKGFVGDSAITVGVGAISAEAQALIHLTEASLAAGIKAASRGKYLNDICGAIEDVIKAPGGYGIVKGYGGHGVGRAMHEDPHVQNFRMRVKGPPLKTGLVIALEPMVTIGPPDVMEESDGWTVSTKSGNLCCHFEHTIAIREGCEAEILTLP
ncbi:MAG: type I methionyl aminopeptidase [Dehalococcoidia bacterium]